MVDNKSNFPVVEREVEQRKRQAQINIAPTAMHQRHLSEGYIIFHGLIADRPTTGNQEIKSYYAEDQKRLYVWNTINNAWEYVVFT